MGVNWHCKLSETEAGEFGLWADGFGGLHTFRTTSDDTVLIVVGMIPIDILTKEINVLYHTRGMAM